MVGKNTSQYKMWLHLLPNMYKMQLDIQNSYITQQ